MGKVNNSFKEEFKNIDDFVKKILFELKLKQKSSKIFWNTASWILGIINFSILALSGFALYKVLSSEHDLSDVTIQAVFICSFSLLLFVATFILSVFQGVMKNKIYISSCENIQYLAVEYKSKGNTWSEEDFKKLVTKEFNHALNYKGRVSIKKTLVQIMTGGNNE